MAYFFKFSRLRGHRFQLHQCHCIVSLSKNINPSLLLVQSRKTRPCITEILLMGHKESIKQTKFFKIKRNFLWLLKLQWAAYFYASFLCLIDAGRSEIQNVRFSKFHPKIKFISPLLKDQKREMCLRNTFSTFQYSFVTDMVSSRHNSHDQKTMHFSVKNSFLHFPTNRHPCDYLVSDLHKKL